MQKGNLSARQFMSYQEVGKFLIETFGREKLVGDLGPADFEFLRFKLKGGPVFVGNQLQWIRSILKWVGEFYGVLPRYGGEFNKPPKREVRRSRRQRTLFEPAEIHKLLKEASPAIKACILLCINCGFGQADCAKLAVKEVDLEKAVINMDRPKTGVQRVCPLWTETVDALKNYVRPNEALPGLFFVTKYGQPWVKENVHHDVAERVDRVTFKDSIALELRKVCKEVGVDTRGFYTFRHTFNTVAEGAGDPNALKVVMGHTFEGMDEFYLHLNRQQEFMQRLQKVTDHVHAWLYESPKQ
jgi:integrase